ncbi:Tc toxin subunit A [Pseudescherichia sp.]|uniref:Tc toxin subunit A n=1 Tax=Pseudescherichia sp. TaxID=2055881 RepID=UPI0028AACB0C|nr:Tc toxin subunit A [Pseudescherichia sp.]
MTLLSSPALQQVETALQVTPGSFANKNYRSVFDIARTSRKQFIADNMSWLGLRGGKAWDLAVGQAQHIRRLFRENQLTRQIRQGLPQTLSGQQAIGSTSSDNIQGLVQDGPTWQNQFAENWQNYCQSGAPEAVDSPVSYLTWLYKQALKFEEAIQASSTAEQVITLAERRPDLATLTVDNDAVNQVVPALQLVNEILEEGIATVLPADQSVDETLAETRYPTLLPYHFPHDQVELALLNAGVPLEEIIGQTSTDWPWFLNDAWRGKRSNNSTELASGLEPEQQTLVTEAYDSAASDRTSFYKTNIGLETADYTPFENLDTFTRQLGMTVPQVEEMVAGNAEGTSVTLSDNCQVGFTLSTAETLTSASLDSGSSAVPLTLSQNGLSVIRGKFSEGIRCDAFQQAEIYLDDNISSDGTNTKPFTLSFWCKIPANIPDMAIIVTNKIDKNARSSQGITLFARHYGDSYQLDLTVSDGTKEPLSTTADFIPNAWIYVAIEIDSATKLYLMNSNDGKVLNIASVIDVKQIDSINMVGEHWGFNSNKGNDYYNAYPECRACIEYDDIAIWDYGITYSTLVSYISSGAPADALSGWVHYYNFDNIDSNGFGSQSQYGAAFINSSAEPAILLDSPTSSELVLSNAAYVDGKYGQGIQTRSGDDSYFYFQPDGVAAQAMKGDKSFTLGFWIKRLQYDARRTPVVTNGGDANVPEYSSGHSLTCAAADDAIYPYDISMYLTDKNNNYSQVDWDGTYGLGLNVWYYIALTWDVTSKQATWYRVENSSVPSFKIDGSGLGDITTTAGFTWAFNTRGDLTPSSISTEDVPNFIYDDIAVFNGVLTEDNITALATSGKPVAEIDLSGLSAECIWANSLNRSLKNLSDARMDRINRMVRLQRWLGLSYEETDLLLSACIRAQGTDNTDFSLNAHTLRALGVFRHWQQTHGVTAFQFAAVLDQITPYAISPAVPFFDQVFNSPSLFDEPFAITGETVSYTDVSGESARRVRQICAGLDITQAQFRVLADKVAAQQGGDAEAKTFPLTLAAVSAFYRLVMVPRWLGLSFADGAALLSLESDGKDSAWNTLAGVPQLALLSNGQSAGGDLLDLLMALDAAVVWAADHKLSWVKSWLALQPESDALVATAATVNFVNGIKQQLPAALLREESFAAVPLPADSTASGWLSVFPDLIDASGLVQVAASSDSAITAMVTADIGAAGITFASDADREQAISSLSGIINQARLAQNGIADSALAQLFSTGQSLPPFLLNWAGDSEYRLLSDSLTLNSGAALTDPSQVPAAYLTDLFALGQRAGISTAFTLTPATLSLFLAHPQWFGVSDTTLSLTLLYRFSRYGDWLKVAGDEERVLAYLSWTNATMPPDTAQAAEALALLLDWESSEVADATASLPDSVAKTVTDVDYVMRLQQLSAQTGLSVTPLLATGGLAPGGVTDTWDAWQSAGESLVAAQSGQQ